MLDLISDGRVEFGTGRSSTRVELEGFGIDPDETREMWDEALDHVVGCWTNDEYEFQGKYWRCPPRRVHPEADAVAAPADLGRDQSSVDGHDEMGELGLGLCSFTVGVPPEDLKERIDIYRYGIAAVHEADRQVRERPGGDVHDGALRADTTRRRCEVG